MDFFDRPRSRRVEGRAGRGVAGPLARHCAQGRCAAARRHADCRSRSSSSASTSTASPRCDSRSRPSGATWKRSRNSSTKPCVAMPQPGCCRVRVFLELAADRVTQSLKAGRRAILYLEIDKQDKLERELGLLAVEEIADAARRAVAGSAAAGRPRRTRHVARLRRAARARQRARSRRVGRAASRDVSPHRSSRPPARSISVTGSVGIALFTSTTDNLAAKLAFAVQVPAHRGRGRWQPLAAARGGQATAERGRDRPHLGAHASSPR